MSVRASGDSLRAWTTTGSRPRPNPPIPEDLQQRGIDFLQELLASGKVDLDRFQKALVLARLTTNCSSKIAASAGRERAGTACRTFRQVKAGDARLCHMVRTASSAS